MTYYKVKPEYDNMRYYHTITGTNKHKIGGFLIADELLTEREFGSTGLSRKFFTMVNINPHNTYTFFGARFEL